MNRLAHTAVLLALTASLALASDPSQRRLIREGMTEGEVLLKIGRPDSESFDTGANATVAVKRWIYLPTPGDSQDITTIVLREGRVIEVERKISRE